MQISNVGNGVLFGATTVIGTPGQDTGPYNNTISYSNFKDIDNEAIWIKEGFSNYSKDDKELHDIIVGEISDLLVDAFEIKKEFSFVEIFELYTILKSFKTFFHIMNS